MKHSSLLAVFSLTAWAASPRPTPIDIEVYSNRSLSDDSIINMSGVDLDPTLSALEVQRRLKNSNLFSEVEVTRDENSMQILVREKLMWFAVPYFQGDSNARIFGAIVGKSSLWGRNGNVVGRLQFGSNNQEASFLVRDEYFLNTRWILGLELNYANKVHRVYQERELTLNPQHTFGSMTLQTGHHVRPNLVLSLDSFLEKHRYQEVDGTFFEGVQFTHRARADWGNYYVDEGLARGAQLRVSAEIPNPLSHFIFGKVGLSAQISLFLRGDFNWNLRPQSEIGFSLPFYQLFTLGGARLRSFSAEQFRDRAYVSMQNDWLLFSFKTGVLRWRPLVYADWAYIQRGQRLGIGTGVNLYFQDVIIPALQFLVGYGVNPSGWAFLATIGPQF